MVSGLHDRLKLAAVICTIGALALSSATSDRALAYEAIAVKAGGAISGVVRFDGTAPAPRKLDITRDKEVCAAAPHFSEELTVGPGGGIKDAVVSIESIAQGVALKPENVRFDQLGCLYQPHVLAFPAGSTVEVLNPDGIAHDLRTYSKANPPLNLVQPKFVKSIKVTLDKPELVKVGCYMHPWMRAWWFVAGNPYYAVTAADGSFTIRNLPAGTYEVSVWQEQLGEQKQSVTVKPGGSTAVNFVFKPTSQPSGGERPQG
jgi:plastocyanin